jgi:hypothetical protein
VGQSNDHKGHMKEEEMWKMGTAALVLGLILAVPVAGFAAPKSTHSTRGVVKSIDSNSLVLERGAGKSRKEMTFALDAATRRQGDITVGSTVAVRYKNDASKLMALDVQPVKAKPVVRKAAARKAAAH